jgi:hypothetical protein
MLREVMSNRPEDLAFKPRPVMFAKTPENPCVRIRVARVERVLVVQVDEQFLAGFGVFGGVIEFGDPA